MDKLGIKWDSVKNCINHSYEGGLYHTGMDDILIDDINDIFEHDRQKLVEYGITLTPAIVINGHPYRNELTG